MLQLGVRASMLLGLLYTPQTVDEIHSAVSRAAGDPDLIDAIIDAGDWDGSPAVTLRALDDGGVPEIELLLERLREVSLADYLTDPDGVRLWRRKPWPTAA